MLIILSVIAFIINYAFLRKKSLYYIISTTGVYLFFLALIGEFNPLLIIYTIFVGAPFMKGIVIKNKVFMIFIFIELIYLFLSLISQNIVITSMTFGTRIMCYFIFIVFYENRIIKKIDIEDFYKGVILATIIELVLGFYLLKYGDVDSAGNIRLVFNSQPISGNMAISVLPLLICLLIYKRDKASMIFICFIVLLFWVILSGTRGYMVIFGLTMFIPLLCFMKNLIKIKKGRKFIIVLFTIVYLSIIIFLIYSIYNPKIIENIFNQLVSVLRLNDSLGIRDYEDNFVYSSFEQFNIFNKLFGLGLGGTGNELSFFRSTITEVFTSSWSMNKYLDTTGLFHNLYTTLIYKQGIFGISIFIMFFLVVAFVIIKKFKKNIKLMFPFLLFIIGFLIMEKYRWSATCGISEMLFFSYTITACSKSKELK